MSNITRDILIKIIVADKMKLFSGGDDYAKQLKSLYHMWSHVSSEELCKVYNKITSEQLTVDSLLP